ncbi:MAG: hypothetical protein P4M12_10920 [Gammaproteobacteria bacterium]|nr:hypothetical protein [Gammaproteobacteria bacterium]
MFDRLQKPFLTVETGEAYQPLRLTYVIYQKEKLLEILNKQDCLVKAAGGDSWSWFWKAECNDVHFESLDSFQRNSDHPVRLGTLTVKGDSLYINLPSFKRACLSAPFFHKLIDPEVACVHHVDFINKVFAVDERLPHGFTELFKEEELERILQQRVLEYHQIQEQCEKAETAEEALDLLEKYTTVESKKRLPYAERYIFDLHAEVESDIVFLSFYIFLRGRELVAIKRWFGNAGYSLADAVDETVEQVFGGMDIDILE